MPRRSIAVEGLEMTDHTKSALALKAVVGHSNGLLEKLLDSLPSAVAATLLSCATVRDVTPGETVVEHGVMSEEIGYVLDGTLAMVQVLEDQKKHIVGLLVPTDIYGRLFDGASSYRIEALSAARILSFPRATFERVLRENPETERLFLLHLLDEMDAAREWLLLISGRKVINRVASFLTILVRRLRVEGSGALVRLEIPFARRALAHYLGARPETLSRAFHELECNGVIRIVAPNIFEVLDEEALLTASGEDLTIGAVKVPGRSR
jgi:CRP/FNR family transcriptional regulator, anaerobic regulatory protein